MKRLKIRKVKSWLRWAKKRYKEKYNIKVKKMIFSKEQLLLVQKFQEQRYTFWDGLREIRFSHKQFK